MDNSAIDLDFLAIHPEENYLEHEMSHSIRLRENINDAPKMVSPERFRELDMNWKPTHSVH
jgi:hypothetical protein